VAPAGRPVSPMVLPPVVVRVQCAPPWVLLPLEKAYMSSVADIDQTRVVQLVPFTSPAMSTAMLPAVPVRLPVSVAPA